MPKLFHQTLTNTAQKTPQADALKLKDQQLSYAELTSRVEKFAANLSQLGLTINARVAIYLPKQFESVISYFATSLAGGIFVPVNPLLKGAQVGHILNDCEAEILITSLSRYKQMRAYFEASNSIRRIILTDCTAEQVPAECVSWQALEMQTVNVRGAPRISQDIAAILYTSGSTGNPKGVVLSHNNLIAERAALRSI